MSKNLYLCVPDPFDSSTGARLERMGILRPDGEVNVEVMRAFVQIFGGLFFDDLCDFYSDQGEVSAVTAAFSLQMSSRYRGGETGGTPCELVMARVLELFQSQYDYILIDCGHSMDLLTINALAAAHQAIVPVQAHYLAMEDMADTLEVIQTIRQGINPKLAVGGILLTMYQGRTNLCRGIQDEIQADYGNAFTVFSSPIDFSIRVAEHPIGAASIFAYEPNNPAAKAYSAVAQEVLSYGQK